MGNLSCCLAPNQHPSSQLGPKIISVRAVRVPVRACNCHSVYLFVRVRLFSKARRHLNLLTWQLAPLITKSNTHQWMSNEAFLREL